MSKRTPGGSTLTDVILETFRLNGVMVAINSAQGAWVNVLSEGLSERQINQALRILRQLRERCERVDPAQPRMP